MKWNEQELIIWAVPSLSCDVANRLNKPPPAATNSTVDRPPMSRRRHSVHTKGPPNRVISMSFSHFNLFHVMPPCLDAEHAAQNAFSYRFFSFFLPFFSIHRWHLRGVSPGVTSMNPKLRTALLQRLPNNIAQRRRPSVTWLWRLIGKTTCPKLHIKSQEELVISIQNLWITPTLTVANEGL